MTRQRSRADSMKAWVSVPEDGDGITRRGIPERKTPFSYVSRTVTPPVSNCDLFLGDKQQNQQNSAKEHAPKSLELTATCSLLSSSIEKEMCETIKENKK